MDATILSVGEDPQLLSLREAVLRTAGFNVLTVSDLEAAFSQMDHGNAVVLLLCYSLPVEVRRQLAKQFRERCPTGHIVAITNMPQAHPPIDADAFLYGIEGAETLIQTVSDQLDVRSAVKKPNHSQGESHPAERATDHPKKRIN
jgi:DNA-binding NtrC family response regulator